MDNEESVPLVLNIGDDQEETDLLLLPTVQTRRRSRRSKNDNDGCCRRLFRCLCSWRYWCWCCGPKELTSRDVTLGCGREPRVKYPKNAIRNQKYSIITFLPMVLYEQFKIFLNLYFLVMALSQFIDALRVGYVYTYWAPLGFVMSITMGREAIDDIRRSRRDREVNHYHYQRLDDTGSYMTIKSEKICVGDIIRVETKERVPADMVLLRTTEDNGSCFIRTDQLDGETDWKLRLPIPNTQTIILDDQLINFLNGRCGKDKVIVHAEKPQCDINTFIGTYTSHTEEYPLSVDNMLWADSILATGAALGLVIYTGRDTRSCMNTQAPHSKLGLLDNEVNNLTKVLFVSTLILSTIMTALRGFEGRWFIELFRFVLLFSYIIPISLRVNLDLAKMIYACCIHRDPSIPGARVRCSTITEELGRIKYLLSDKTGTLTKNEMVLRKLHLGNVFYNPEGFREVSAIIRDHFSTNIAIKSTTEIPLYSRSVVATQTVEAVIALALCHNVSPSKSGSNINMDAPKITYQASSPDEVALVQWTELVGLRLCDRNPETITLCAPEGKVLVYTILHVFPFTSTAKRMGLVVQDNHGVVTFYVKGADVVMIDKVQYSDWLQEECGNLAREGLRTLVVAKKILKPKEFAEFETHLQSARCSLGDRADLILKVLSTIENEMEVLCVTGVEDQLQDGIRQTLELLHNAGIKVWMLTGDKLETALCIAKSSRLIVRNQELHIFSNVTSRTEAHLEINAFRRKNDCALIITGETLQYCLDLYEYELMEVVVSCPVVIVCRCAPTEKATVARLLKRHTNFRIAAIGDGGNDVSMIQAAHAGIGLEGHEGRQAALAADFSLKQFQQLGPLLLIHGRHSYKRSAALSQFIMHRGLVISIIQAIFSAAFAFTSISLYQGFLLIGYVTVYTNFPVFALLWDRDISDSLCLRFPELYAELSKGRSLSYKTFLIWVVISLYQGGALMAGALLLFPSDMLHIVAITFSSLVLSELITVGLAVHMWHPVMLIGEALSLICYGVSLFIFRNYFDVKFLLSWNFYWKVLVLTSISCIPLYILKFVQRKISPPSYSKLA